MNPDIIPRFTANNQLVISLENLNLEHGSFKLCFSLVYSIQSLKGARILKQIGRYYELETKNNEPCPNPLRSVKPIYNSNEFDTWLIHIQLIQKNIAIKGINI